MIEVQKPGRLIDVEVFMPLVYSVSHANHSEQNQINISDLGAHAILLGFQVRLFPS